MIGEAPPKELYVNPNFSTTPPPKKIGSHNNSHESKSNTRGFFPLVRAVSVGSRPKAASYRVSDGLIIIGQYPGLATSQKPASRECLHIDIIFVESSFLLFYKKPALPAP